VPYVLAKCKQIVTAVNKGYHKWMHKYGIEIPKNYDDCMQIDCENGNTLWQDAIHLEMVKVWITFQICNDDESIPPTYQQIHTYGLWHEDGGFLLKGMFCNWWSHDQDPCN
jgi:hypothetical protein